MKAGETHDTCTQTMHTPAHKQEKERSRERGCFQRRTQHEQVVGDDSFIRISRCIQGPQSSQPQFATDTELFIIWPLEAP